ncbi:P-loop containing nucleoside triphosphate hydrolase protein, partial [Caulochytrium protostelioides]
RVPAIPPAGSGGVRLPRFDGHLALQNVAFSYPGRPNAPVLEDFTLTLRPGQVLALIGPSGHGKSTVLHLLQRFYDPTRGRVLLDHTCPLSKVDLRWYRRHIGYVPQDPVLFDGTIHDNIAMGWADDEDDMDAGQDRRSVIAAAQTANAHEFIMEFPLGYDTPVGERGLALSGGQKQRIALARALVRDPRVLLLDEATSALSSDAEAAVQRSVARASAGRTTVVVGHKLSAFKDADRCAVIVRGRVVELGSHDELM